MKRYLLLASAAALLSTPSFAQDAHDDSDDEAIIVTALGIEQPQSDANVAIGVLTEDQIERQGTATVIDQIARLPGVSISRNGPVGGFAGVRIRGAEAEQTRVLIDGIAVNDPSSPGGGFDFGTLLSTNIQQLEVLRGANSTTWGNQALGGVVSIQTLAPDDHGLNVQALAEYGSHDSKRASIGVADQRGPVAFAFGGGYYDTDGISAAANGTEADGMRQYLAHGRMDISLAAPVTAELRGFYAHNRVDLDGYDFTVNGIADLPAYSTSQQANGYGGLKISLLNDKFVSRIGYSIADYNRDNFDNEQARDASFKARGQTETIAYKGDWTVASGHRLLFGLERETNHLKTADAWSSLTASNHDDSAYAQWLFQPDDRLNLVAGVRYDHHSDYGGHTSFSASGSYKLSPALRIKTSFSEGYKAPTLYQLDGSKGGFGNPELQPETARAFDGGIEARLLDGTLILGATAFTRTSKNQIAFGDCTMVADLPRVCRDGNRPSGSYFNLTKTRANGIELEATAQPIPNLVVTANYSLLNAKDISANSVTNGNRLARRPEHSLNSAISYEHPSGWMIAADMRIVSDSFDDAYNGVRLDGYQLFGLRANVPVGQYLSLFGRVENLTDVRYQTAFGYNSMGRTASVGVRARY